MPIPIVQVRNLTKLYRHGEIDATALENVSLDIDDARRAVSQP